MVDQWAFMNIDGARIAEARAHASDMRQAEANMREAQRIIDRLYGEKVEAETALAEQTKAVARMNQLIRELIADGIVDRADAKARLARIQGK